MAKIINNNIQNRKGPKVLGTSLIIDNDFYGNEYKIEKINNTLTITVSTGDIDQEMKDKIALFNGPVSIVVQTQNQFNRLSSELSRTEFDKDLTIDVYNLDIQKKLFLDFESLPQNVKVSAFHVENNVDSFSYNDNFATWCLWLNDLDFKTVRDKLTPRSKKEMVSREIIANGFYEELEKKHRNIDMLDSSIKMNEAYEWCKHNISYASETVDKNGNIFGEDNWCQNPVETFRKHRGVCVGRARLLKTMVNNKYLKVDCYTATGTKGNLPHEWNEFVNGDDIYSFDLSFDVKFETDIEKHGYYNIQHSAEVKEIVNKNGSIKR